MNERSSRSHALFILTVARRDVADDVTRFSQLYLCDLAGSEKVWKTQTEGQVGAWAGGRSVPGTLLVSVALIAALGAILRSTLQHFFRAIPGSGPHV